MQKLTQTDVEQATLDYMLAQQKKKEQDAEFNEKKKQYYDIMHQAFDSDMFGGDAASFEFDRLVNVGNGEHKTFAIKTTRVLPTVINWDIDKLKKRLNKSILRKVIKRNRTLVDLQGLVNYMRELGGEPKIFWSFFDTTEFVDQHEIDQASDLGYIEDEDVAGCFSVTVKSESYRVTSREVEYDDEEQAD